jgi:chondroitin AC lyase
MLDAIDTTIRYSFFMSKTHLLKKAIAYAEKEIFISEGDMEGIKMDYSFYQHGAQQAIASYGLVYVSNIAKIAYFLNGTSFQISEEKLGLLVDFIIYGQRYAFRGNQSNYLTNGRSYSRREGSNGNNLKIAIGLLLSLDNIPKKDKLQEFYYSFDNLSYSPQNTTYFPYSHTLFDVSPDYYMAAKGAYKGFINSELVNSENLLARNMAYGGLTTYQYTGYEYNNIGALWDFSMLPGTTAFNETDEMLAAYPGRVGSSKYQSVTTHSGGAADGELGGLYVDIENEEGLYSRQAYISNQGLMICLGNSITSSNSSNTRQIYTTINQVYAENATYKNSQIEGIWPINDTSVVYNGAFAYYNLGEGNMTATVNQINGNLTRNNLAASGTYTNTIFKLYYSYGIKPENQTFAYAVLANPKRGAPADATGLPIAKITNTNEIQAVEFVDGRAVIIFHKPGNFTRINGVVVSASTDCVKILSI